MGRGGGDTHVMHGCTRMIIDPPRIRTMPGRGRLGFHRRSRHRVHQVRSAIWLSASLTKGKLHPTNSLSLEYTAERGYRRAAMGNVSYLLYKNCVGGGVVILLTVV